MSDTPIDRIHGLLQKLMSLHRELMECVRLERQALTHADLKKIQEVTYHKEAVIHSIRQVEADRLRTVEQLGILWRISSKDLTLNEIILKVQDVNPKLSEQLRSAYQALMILVKRIQEQNESNRALVENSLSHVGKMKQNVLGEASPSADVYNQSGQKAQRPSSGSRLISKEV